MTRTIDNGAGERVTWLHRSDELLEFEVTMQPGAGSPPPHLHPRQEERFRALSGTLEVVVEGQARTLKPGEMLTIAPGTVHTFAAGGDEPARAHVEFRPALDFDAFLETVFTLRRTGRTNAQGMPNPLQLAVILHHYLPRYRLAKPPLAVQRIIFGLLAPIGRLAGYRARVTDDQVSASPR